MICLQVMTDNLMKKRVLIVTGLYPPEIGGPATYTKLMEDELPKYGYQVLVLPFSTVRHLPKIIRHEVFIFKIIKLAKKVDIIFAQDTVSVGLPALVVAKILRKKFIVRVPGDYAWEQGVNRFGVTDLIDEFQVKTYRPSVEALRWVQKTVVKQASDVVVPSQYLQGIVTGWGVNPIKVKLIYNSFKPIQLEKTKAELRQQLSWSGLVLFSAGRLVSWKGFEVLIDVMPELPGVRLFIAGSGPLATKLQTKIDHLGLNERVEMLGQVDQETLFNMVTASDIFVLNTAYEGLSHQLLEVMSLGTPIITTNVGGNTELISNKESGVLFKFDDKQELISAIQVILNSPEARQKLADNARASLTKFELAGQIKKLIAIF